jgi:ATP-binding cassette subfamily F protein uup
MILVDASGVSMSRPGRPLFHDLSVTISSGDRLGIVGLNGTGKSTLLRVLIGAEQPESGVVRRGRDLRVSFLDQRAPLPPGTVRDVIGPSWESQAVADRLGLADVLDADTTTLSGGQAKRVALARTLVAECDLLVLDEPTNHLDIDAIAWLEDRLTAFRGGLVLVTHDRHVLDRLTTRILELDRGTGYVHDGGYAGYLDARAEREERAAVAETTRRNLARRELAWLRRGAPARTRKSKARIERASELIATRPDAPARDGDLDLLFEGTPRLGDQVVELHGVGHGYDDTDLFAGLDLALDRRERLGIVGANGTGKSTLLDVIAGRIVPRHGRVVRGPTVVVGYYDQTGRELDPAQRVREAIAGDARQPDWRDARLLERFWFDGDAQWAPIGLLSGGERRRLQLVLTLAARPNVLLLDEPTNDLDLDTLRALEDFLEEWPGALVVVSHDRAFLERTIEDVVVLDGHGRAGRVPGGYAAWEDERRATRTAGTLRRRPPAPVDRADGGDRADGADGPGRPPRNAVGGVARAKGPSPSTLRARLRQVEKELQPLEKRRAALTERLASTTDHRELADLGEQLAAVSSEVVALEERWLELAGELDGCAGARRRRPTRRAVLLPDHDRAGERPAAHDRDLVRGPRRLRLPDGRRPGLGLGPQPAARSGGAAAHRRRRGGRDGAGRRRPRRPSPAGHPGPHGRQVRRTGGRRIPQLVGPAGARRRSVPSLDPGSLTP